MEVFFLDVAQGTAHVILLGGRRAIIIDCGTGNDDVLLHFLRWQRVDFIDWLIVSHSDSDHIGGACSVLVDYADQIGHIGVVQDSKFLKSEFWQLIKEMWAEQKLKRNQLERLEYRDTPMIVWQDRRRNATLKTYSPSTATNLIAQESGRNNPTSAILFFKVGDHQIVFASDSDVDQWREIHSINDQRPIDCRVLSVPHHGGKMHSSQSDLQWLYNDALRPEIAIFSVGSSNSHDHPRDDVMNELRSRGVTLLCTQLTPKCNGFNGDLERFRPGVLAPVYPGRSRNTLDRQLNGRSRNVACAGTICLRAADNKMQIERSNEHQTAVDQLGTNPCPLCRQQQLTTEPALLS